MINRNATDAGFIETYTSGGLLIPKVSEPLNLRLYISNLSPGTESVTFQFNRLDDPDKTTLITGNVAVPASGAATIELDPAALGLSGEVVEAVVQLPLIEPPGTFSLHPSLSLLQGGTNGVPLPVAIALTGDFSLVKEEQVPSPFPLNRLRDIPSNLFALTWGLFDIPRAQEGFLTEVTLWLSSFSNQEENAVVTVNSLAAGSTQKQHLFTLPVNVPAGEAAAVPIEGVDGLAIEAIVEIPFAAPPLTVLPLLTPSITVNRQNIASGEINIISFISPGQALFADR